MSIPMDGSNSGEVPNPLVELRKWSVFSTVDPQLLSKVKLAYVFSHDEYELTTGTGFLVTVDEEVYSVGSNDDGRLGIGSLIPQQTSTVVKVQALCGKKVSGFTCFSHQAHVNCFALTSAGLVFSWGDNVSGALAHESTIERFTVPTLIEGLREKKVVQLVSGCRYGLALTSGGEVYGWGVNVSGQLGNGRTENVLSPVRVTDVIGGITMSTICNGGDHSLAVSPAGELFAWGGNEYGQLGNGTTTDSNMPIRITLPGNEQISKVACGYYHTMALTTSGKLYTWGYNGEGQLGNESTDDSATPIEVQVQGPIVDIAAVNYKFQISACATKSKVYIWGDVWGKRISRPVETTLTRIEEAFWVYSNPQVMHQSLVFGTESEENICPTLAQDLESSFDHQATADVEFVSESENKRIHAHKTILRIRSTYFCTMFKEEWNESVERSFEIHPSVSFKSFHALLYFLYTDKVEFPQESWQEIWDLLKVADFYSEIRLRSKCESILARGITVNNTVPLYAMTSKYNAKVLQEFAYKFIMENRNEIQFPEQVTEGQMDLSDVTNLLMRMQRSEIVK